MKIIDFLFRKKQYDRSRYFRTKYLDAQLPAIGKFVCESHYVTTQDGVDYPLNPTHEIARHLYNSAELLRPYFKKELTLTDIVNIVYSKFYTQQWTPAENGKIGQGARGTIRQTPWNELWQANAMFGDGQMPPMGTKYILENPNNGKKVVVNMGFEVGPSLLIT